MRLRRTVPVASPRAAQAVDLHANATLTTCAMLFGAVLLLPVALVEGLVPAMARLDWRLLGLVVVIGLLLVNWLGGGQIWSARPGAR
jgi:hypothetical protein